MDKFSVVVNGLGNVAVGCVQHQGAREQQEDSVGFTPVNGDPMDGFLAVVADGMGGMASGAGRCGECWKPKLADPARHLKSSSAKPPAA